MLKVDKNEIKGSVIRIKGACHSIAFIFFFLTSVFNYWSAVGVHVHKAISLITSCSGLTLAYLKYFSPAHASRSWGVFFVFVFSFLGGVLPCFRTCTCSCLLYHLVTLELFQITLYLKMNKNIVNTETCVTLSSAFLLWSKLLNYSHFSSVFLVHFSCLMIVCIACALDWLF